jgi:hypothetical protein
MCTLCIERIKAEESVFLESSVTGVTYECTFILLELFLCLKICGFCVLGCRKGNPRGKTINANVYCDTLRRLHEAIRRRSSGRLSRGLIFHYGNTMQKRVSVTRTVAAISL